MKIITIALNTFRESVRDRVLYNLVIFVLLLVISSVVMGRIAFGQEAKIVIDAGLTAMTLFGLIIAVFIGIGLVSKEIEKRTIAVILSKPVRRSTFVLGKYFGLSLIPAYRFGAFFLRYIDQEKAISFAEQGIRNNPDQWRLYQDLGFVYFREGRYREAGEVYKRGSRVAGAPAWMHAMAASMIAKGGDRETSREMFRRLCEGSEDRFIKQICAERD